MQPVYYKPDVVRGRLDTSDLCSGPHLSPRFMKGLVSLLQLHLCLYHATYFKKVK